jgi:hypothetical protein
LSVCVDAHNQCRRAPPSSLTPASLTTPASTLRALPTFCVSWAAPSLSSSSAPVTLFGAVPPSHTTMMLTPSGTPSPSRPGRLPPCSQPDGLASRAAAPTPFPAPTIVTSSRHGPSLAAASSPPRAPTSPSHPHLPSRDLPGSHRGGPRPVPAARPPPHGAVVMPGPPAADPAHAALGSDCTPLTYLAVSPSWTHLLSRHGPAALLMFQTYRLDFRGAVALALGPNLARLIRWTSSARGPMDL